MTTETRKDSSAIDTDKKPSLAFIPTSVSQSLKHGGSELPDANEVIKASPEARGAEVIADTVLRIGEGAVKFGDFLRSLTAEGVKDLFSLRPLSAEERKKAGLPPRR